MIEPYLSSFTPAPFKININESTGSQVSEPTRNELIESLTGSYRAESTKAVAVVVISDEARSKSTSDKIQKQNASSVIEPEPGVMLKKDDISYLSEYQGVDQRISMIKVNSDTVDIDSSKLSNLLSEVEQKSPNLVNLINNAGGSSSEEISLVGQVELGGYRGGDFIFDNNGNIVGQQYNGPVDRVQNESTNSISIQTKSGSEIKIGLTISDQMNGQGLQGAAREISLTYSSSQELTEEETSELNKILESVQSLSSSFHESYSVQQSDVSTLNQSIQETSDLFESVNVSLKFEAGNFQRQISMTSTDEGEFTVNVSEKDMKDAYTASYRNSSYLKMNMNELPTEASQKIESAINRNEFNPYQEAIIEQSNLNNSTHGAYINSMFEK